MAFSVNVANGETAYKAVLRQLTLTPQLKLDAALLTTHVALDGWTPRMVAQELYDKAKMTTSVAVASYQFFTGLTPLDSGLNYLVADAANLTDLNDGYYQRFNMESRFINFAVNLGVQGAGRDWFTAQYGALSFDAAVAKAYDTILGFNYAQGAGVDLDVALKFINSAQPYFKTFARAGLPATEADLTTKAAMVGYVMYEAIKADIGRYAHAIENFYLDLADGTAEYHIDLVGVYGPGTGLDAFS